MIKRRNVRLALVAGLLLAAAACGDDDDSGADPTDAPTATEAAGSEPAGPTTAAGRGHDCRRLGHHRGRRF